MIKIDLITGFLGSGKTTFIKKYAEYLISQGERICILENDYGAINIDMVLLNDLLGPNCELEMVVGGDGAAAHQRRFRTKLISMGMLGYTRVIIEPSGIYDMDEFFDTLCESPLDRWYEIGSIITIVDAHTDTGLSKKARYLLASESACAGKIVLSRIDSMENAFHAKDDIRSLTDNSSDYRHSPDTARHDAISATIEYLNSSLELFGCKRSFLLEKDIIAKSWDELTDRDFLAIKSAGYKHASIVKLPLTDGDDFQSLFYINFRTTETDLRQRISELLSDTSAGNIIRIKGFVALSESTGGVSLEYTLDETVSGVKSPGENRSISDIMKTGHFMEVNATKEGLNIRSTEKPSQEVLIIIGEKLDKNIISGYFPGAVTV